MNDYRRMLRKRLVFVIVVTLALLSISQERCELWANESSSQTPDSASESAQHKDWVPVQAWLRAVVDKHGDTLEMTELTGSDFAFKVFKGMTGFKAYLHRDYGVRFSELDRMSKKEIDLPGKRFLADHEEFVPVDIDELVLVSTKKDSSLKRSDTDGTQFRKWYRLTYSQVVGEVAVHGAAVIITVQSDGRIRDLSIEVYPNANVETAPLISGSEAVPLAKKHLRLNAEQLEFQDTVRHYWHTSCTVAGDQRKIGKAEAIKIITTKKPELVEIVELKRKLALSDEQMREEVKKGDSPFQVLDTSRIHIDMTYTNRSTDIRVRVVMHTEPATLHLTDTVQLFVLPRIEGTTMHYHLAYRFRIESRPYEGYAWNCWVDARTGDVIHAYKDWSGPPKDDSP